MKHRTKIRQATLNSLIHDTIDNSANSYILVDKRVLNIDCVVNFNLYRHNEVSQMQLYLQSDTVIDETHKKNLDDVMWLMLKFSQREIIHNSFRLVVGGNDDPCANHRTIEPLSAHPGSGSGSGSCLHIFP